MAGSAEASQRPKGEGPTKTKPVTTTTSNEVTASTDSSQELRSRFTSSQGELTESIFIVTFSFQFTYQV
jgi:hypothetical protein